MKLEDSLLAFVNKALGVISSAENSLVQKKKEKRKLYKLKLRETGPTARQRWKWSVRFMSVSLMSHSFQFWHFTAEKFQS